MVSYVDDYKTVDGYVFRVSLVAFSQRRINTEKKHQIRVHCRQFLQERLPKLTVDEFIKEVPLGNLNNDLLEAVKKLTPLRHIGIKKTFVNEFTRNCRESMFEINDLFIVEHLIDEPMLDIDSARDSAFQVACEPLEWWRRPIGIFPQDRQQRFSLRA